MSAFVVNISLPVRFVNIHFMKNASTLGSDRITPSSTGGKRRLSL